MSPFQETVQVRQWFRAILTIIRLVRVSVNGHRVLVKKSKSQIFRSLNCIPYTEQYSCGKVDKN